MFDNYGQGLLSSFGKTKNTIKRSDLYQDLDDGGISMTEFDIMFNRLEPKTVTDS